MSCGQFCVVALLVLQYTYVCIYVHRMSGQQKFANNANYFPIYIHGCRYIGDEHTGNGNKPSLHLVIELSIKFFRL